MEEIEVQCVHILGIESNVRQYGSIIVEGVGGGR